jgi:protein-disulfide isomerase
VNDASASPHKTGIFGAALAGGIIGSLLTAAILFFAFPDLLSSKIVRRGLLADPKILSDAVETPFGSSWKGAAKPEVTLVEFFDYACPYCKASNPSVERLINEDKGLRVVYRELPILGPESVTAARLSLEASKLGRFAQFHDTLWSAGRPAPDTIAKAAQAAGVAPQPKPDADVEAELKRNFALAGQLGATGTPLFVVGDRVMNGAVGYDTLKQAIDQARTKADR